MSHVTKEDRPPWHRRLGYRLRRAHYRTLEFEAAPPPDPQIPDHAHPHKHEHAHKHESDKAFETLREQLLRAQAEFENFRKRIKREQAQRIELASQGVVEQLLPVLDNFHRAVANPGESVESLLSGIGMVHKQFEDILGLQGLERIAPLGKPFDPTLHEAVGVALDTGQPENTVVDVFQPGYTLKGRLLRPAMVRVAGKS